MCVHYNVPNLRSNKDTFFNFCFTDLRKFVTQVCKSIAALIHSFNEVLHQPQLDMQGRHNNAVFVNQWLMNNVLVTWLHTISDRPFLSFIMFLPVSTVPFTNKTTKLSIAKLHAHEESNDFEIAT